MTRIHRLVVTVISALIVGALTSTAGFAAGFLGPGHASNDFADASAFWSPDANNPYFVELSVSRNEFVFRPTQNSGGTSVIEHATVLFITIDGPAVAGSDCFVIPDSDFVVGSDAQSASLHATVNAIDRCSGPPLTLAELASGKPGGGPPPIPGIQFPLTISANWTGSGPTTTVVSDGRATCGGFSMEDHIIDSAGRATAGASLSMPNVTVTASFTDQAGVDLGTLVTDIQGTPAPACFGI